MTLSAMHDCPAPLPWPMTRSKLDKFAFLPSAKHIFWLLVAIACALYLCSSVFFFTGSKVDESEVVLNALSIAAGDWSPKWSPGYGHLAMYLPGAALAMASLFMQATGAAANHADALYLLFEHEAAYRITRFVYALADVGTALVFARVIWKVTGMHLVAAASVVYFLLSPDTWQYANFIRTDALVSFFTAIASYTLVRSRTKATPYMLGIALGAAIACKYSAAAYLGLILLLLLPDDSASNLRQRLGMVLIAGLTAMLATFAFQPHYDYSGILSAIHTHLAGTKFIGQVAPPGERMLRLWGLVKQLEPLALVFLATMWFGLLRPLRAAPVLLAVLIGIAPFALSNFPRDYWLIPFADALRGAGWLGLACMIGSLAGRSVYLGRALGALLMVGLVAVIAIRLPDLQRMHRAPHGITNVEAAKRWLYVNVANRERLIYAYEKNFLLPRAYSFRDYGEAAAFSRVFIFYREGFESLHELFRRYLYNKEFEEFTSVGQVPAFWVRTNSDGSNAPPRLCAGEKCYSPKVTACDAAPSVPGPCSRYVWNMGRPEFRISLSRMSLELDPSVSTLGLCWYNCRPGALMVSAAIVERGKVPLIDLSAYLFAPAEVRSLKEIRRMSVSGQRLFIVTTPKAYEPWMAGAGMSAEARGKPGAFAGVIGARLVQRFYEGQGPVIEIYEKVPKRGSGSG